MRTSVATTRTWAIQLVLCSFALSACGTDAEDPQTTTETTTETSELSDGSQVLCQTCAPHESAVKLVKSGTTFCSGSVISSNRVLTSAKCLKANAFTPTNLCITNRIQSTSCGGASEMYNVSRGFVHPSFIGTSSGSDAAVLEVDHPLRPFGNASGTIPALPIDTGIFGNDFQGDDFGFGTNPQIPSLTGQKQVRSGVPSVATSQPGYIGFGTLTVLTGDFGGGLISGFNSLAGINSFVQNGKSFMTRTQPIRSWIASPDIVVGSTPACFLGGQFFVSVHNGMCLQAASSGSGVSLEFCNCTALQRWNRLQGAQGLVFQNVQRNMCLNAPGPTPSVGISSCFTGDRFQNWLLFNTNTQAQLTNASGPTLLTQDTNVVTVGGSNSFNRWWNIQPKQAALTPIQISADPFTTTDSQHATQVEPDSYSFGSTIVAASQTGRFANGGGATGIAFATSTDSGVHWTTDVLPALTTANGGTLDRVTDPSVAFDARHNVWMVVTLGIRTTDAAGSQVRVSRSTNGGLTWSNPVTVAMAPSPFGFDKTWVACDNVSTSPFYGNCYAEWDDSAFGGIIEMSTSTDGGVTWGTPRSPADNASGVGGQPVVLPNGPLSSPYPTAPSPTCRRSDRRTVARRGAPRRSSLGCRPTTWRAPCEVNPCRPPKSTRLGASTLPGRTAGFAPTARPTTSS
jgi:hypothetical protein